MREFGGFKYQDETNKNRENDIKEKIAFAKDNFTLGELSHICNVLAIDYDAANKKLAHIEGSENENKVDVEENVSVTPISDGRKKVNDEGRDKDWNNDDDDAESIGATSARRIPTAAPKFVITFKDIEETIPAFNGRENYPIDKWISAFKDMALLMNWNDVEKLVYLRRL